MTPNQDTGLVMIFTGEGKGKTTSALGAALRAAGQGLRVLIIQFIKGGRDYGELSALEHIPQVELRPMGLGLIPKNADPAPHREKARQAWQAAQSEAASGRWDMLILDEVFPALGRGFVEQAEVAGLVAGKPSGLHLLLTGRGCPEELYAQADLVTLMQPVKHHFEQGITAQAGIEY